MFGEPDGLRGPASARQRLARRFWIWAFRFVKMPEPEWQVDYPQLLADWFDERETLMNGE